MLPETVLSIDWPLAPDDQCLVLLELHLYVQEISGSSPLKVDGQSKKGARPAETRKGYGH
jgi:hypothetical protein